MAQFNHQSAFRNLKIIQLLFNFNFEFESLFNLFVNRNCQMKNGKRKIKKSYKKRTKKNIFSF